MNHKLVVCIVVGMCACDEEPRPAQELSVSVSALAITSADASPSLQAVEPDSCEMTRDELDAARHQLGTVQRDHEQLAGELGLSLKFMAQGRPLALESAYDTAVGRIKFRNVRYWLSQLQLVREDGSRVDIPDSYYLLESRSAQQLRGGTQQPVTLPARQRELLSLKGVEPGKYRALSFNVGVDARHNDDLSLTAGELTTLQNMASIQWMWFTSYIFTQLDAVIAGSEADQNDAGVPIDLQVLWENGTNQDLRRVELTLPATAQVGYQLHPQIALEVEITRLFEGLADQLTLARASSPDAPWSSISAMDEAARKRLADNWSQAFRATAVTHGPL